MVGAISGLVGENNGDKSDCVVLWSNIMELLGYFIIRYVTRQASKKYPTTAKSGRPTWFNEVREILLIIYLTSK